MYFVDMKYSLDSMFPSKIRLTLSTLVSSCNVVKLLPQRDYPYVSGEPAAVNQIQEEQEEQTEKRFSILISCGRPRKTKT